MRDALGDGVPCANVNVRTCSNPNFFLAVASMAMAFFSLLFALSWGDVSLVAPAAGTASAWPDAMRANLNNGQDMKNF